VLPYFKTNKETMQMSHRFGATKGKQCIESFIDRVEPLSANPTFMPFTGALLRPEWLPAQSAGKRRQAQARTL
jgi:hypothetical protein